MRAPDIITAHETINAFFCDFKIKLDKNSISLLTSKKFNEKALTHYIGFVVVVNSVTLILKRKRSMIL
jgi:hypothetical protein